MSIFRNIGYPSAVKVSVHPRTTNVVLQQNADSSNVLVGYVMVKVQRTTEVSQLVVKFSGVQHLDMRDGQGPSSSLFSVRHQCARLVYTLVECSATSSADSISAAMAVERARVCSRRSSEDSGWNNATEFNTNIEEDLSGLQALELTSFSSTGMLSLEPGEYRFPFELALPARLPVSVMSPMGKVEYRMEAEVQRASWMFYTTVASEPVEIRVQQEPRLTSGLTINPMLLGFPSFHTLATTPLLFETIVAAGQWKISVYSASSRALFLGMPLKLRVYATRAVAANQDVSEMAAGDGLEMVEFGVSLRESITHVMPGCTAAAQTTDRVVAASSLCPRHLSQKERELLEQCNITNGGSAGMSHVLDPQTVDALGESFEELPSVGSLTLDLSTKGPYAVQPSSVSPMFTVSHTLRIDVVMCEDCVYDSIGMCIAPTRVSCSAAVVVLPETLRTMDSTASAPLPCYGNIANDVVLAASPNSVTATSLMPAGLVTASPPAYK